MKYMDEFVREIPLTLVINDEEKWTLLCEPSHLKALVVGFLYANYYIQGLDDLDKVIIDEEKGMCYIELQNNLSIMNHRYVTSGCVDSAVFYRMLDAITNKPLQKKALNTTQIRSLKNAINSLEALSAIGWSKTHNSIVKDVYPVNRIYKIVGEQLIESKQYEFIILDENLTMELLIACKRSNIHGICYRGYVSEKAIRFSEKMGIDLVSFQESGDIFVQGKKLL